MNSLLDHIKQNRKDAVTWQIERYMEHASGPYEKKLAIDQIALLIGRIQSNNLRENYIDIVCKRKEWAIKAKQLNDVLAVEQDDELETGKKQKKPDWMDEEELEMKGFCTVVKENRIGYYAWATGGKMEVSNFIIHPIFHVKGDADDSRHIFEVQNIRGRQMMDVPSKVFVSTDVLQGHLVAKGAYMFYGTKNNLLRIAAELLPSFPLCDELKQLGWQPEGFFAWVNKIFHKPKANVQQSSNLLEVSKWGVAQIGNKHFLIPAASELFKDFRDGDDMFSEQRSLSYIPSPVDFSAWAAQMVKVWGEKGPVGIAAVFISAFRDIVYKVNQSCPHMYFYGERSSGKSQFAISISSIFYKHRPAFQLNSGTDAAFFEYMRMFNNCIAWLNEFGDKETREEWFQAIKGVYDGEGRRRMNMKPSGGRKNVEMQLVKSVLIITGQYISTKDDNSVVSRSILEPFAERQYTEAEKEEFDKLSKWQEAGLTGLLGDILQHREMIASNYYETYNEIITTWRKRTKTEFNQRIFQNWCHLSAMWCLLETVINLPVKWVNFDLYCYKKAVEYSTFIRKSDKLTDFWKTVEFLLDQQKITDGWDFVIKECTELTLRNSDGKEDTIKYLQPKKILFLRLNNVHQLYTEIKNRGGNKDAMTTEGLKHYFSSRPYFIGQVKQVVFKRLVFKPVETVAHSGPGTAPQINITTQGTTDKQNSSAYVFDYDLLDCNLERLNDTPELPF